MSIIQAVADSYKVPGFIGETVHGAGAASIGDAPLKLLVVALKKTSGGTIATNTEVAFIDSEDTADTKAGAGSEAARACYAALRIPGVQLYLACPAPAGSAVAAAATATIGGTWSTSGVLRFTVGGDDVDVAISAAMTVDDAAAAIATAVTAKSRLRTSCASVDEVATFTDKSAGARGNDLILFVDRTGAPSGLTCTLAGGAAVNGDSATGAGVRFTGGVGVETMTTLLATIANDRYDRIVPAQNDATSIAAWETQIDAMAGPTRNKTQHAVFASTATSMSTATAVAQTTANNPRMQCLHMKDGETPAVEMASVFGAMRAVEEQSNPNRGYDGRVLPGVRGQRYKPSWPNEATQISALDNSVTPVDSNDAGEAVVVRSITTKSETAAGDPDYRTLDTAEAVVPDYVREDLRIFWTTSFVVDNPYVRGDAADEEPLPPAGVATPKLWNSEIFARLQDHERNLFITQVSRNPPKTTFNATAGWLESIVPVVPLPLQHAIKVSVRQNQYAA